MQFLMVLGIKQPVHGQTFSLLYSPSDKEMSGHIRLVVHGNMLFPIGKLLTNYINKSNHVVVTLQAKFLVEIWKIRYFPA